MGRDLRPRFESPVHHIKFSSYILVPSHGSYCAPRILARSLASPPDSPGGAMLLTSRMVRAARPRERRYVLADEHGMSLHVMPWGSKWWRFRYRFQQTRRVVFLAVYPHIHLANGR